MPSAQVELDHGDETFEGVIDIGHRQQGLGVCHETDRRINGVSDRNFVTDIVSTYFVMRSSMDRGSRMKVGRTTRLRSAPGRSCEIMWERTNRAGQQQQSHNCRERL